MHLLSVHVRAERSVRRLQPPVSLRLQLTECCQGTQGFLAQWHGWYLISEPHRVAVFTWRFTPYHLVFYPGLTPSYSTMKSSICHCGIEHLWSCCYSGKGCVQAHVCFQTASLSGSCHDKSRMTYQLQNSSGMKALKIICNRTDI